MCVAIIIHVILHVSLNHMPKGFFPSRNETLPLGHKKVLQVFFPRLIILEETIISSSNLKRRPFQLKSFSRNYNENSLQVVLINM